MDKIILECLFVGIYFIVAIGLGHRIGENDGGDELHWFFGVIVALVAPMLPTFVFDYLFNSGEWFGGSFNLCLMLFGAGTGLWWLWRLGEPTRGLNPQLRR